MAEQQAAAVEVIHWEQPDPSLEPVRITELKIGGVLWYRRTDLFGLGDRGESIAATFMRLATSALGGITKVAVEAPPPVRDPSALVDPP